MTTDPSAQNPDHDDHPGGATPPPPAGGGTPPPPGYSAPGAYPPPPPAGPTSGAQPLLSDSDQRLWATLSHVGGILFGFVPPLVIWLIFKERGRFVEEQAKEALNWQITLAIAYVIGWVTSVILIGILILVAAGLAALIFGILAAVAANKGEAYRYPFALRLVK
ncbi:DUF4870 domain-containing protein [Actinotalea sp. C106]|uniref:DUF4870 domain-containing protein n=1 Tax=Actinotalea sp. C106 TaxID=2908644 RepID=UPI0020279198|nr:DUF4870 domain-containing protein [Actinotalea sp. C106]